MFSAFLPKRAVLSLGGEEVIYFLQGLISNDARLLEKNKPIYAALLSPQGKFLHDFFLVPYQNKIFVDISADRANDLLNRLKIYRLRSKVEIKTEDDFKVGVLWNTVIPAKAGIQQEESLDANLRWHDKNNIYPDPRLKEMGYRALVHEVLDPVLVGATQDEKEYEKHRLSLGVPDTTDMIIDKSLLLQCGFEDLGGVDFNKGCYVGQEVTARSKFRGQVRKSFYKVSADKTLPILGTKITVGDKTIGEIRTSVDNIGLAIINHDDYENAKNNGNEIVCAEIKITVTPAEYKKISK